MLFLENLKPLKVYKRPLFLPTLENDKKKKSAIMLLTPNYESSKALMASPLTINRLRFASYYIEKDITYFISSKVMNKTDDVTESYVRNFSESDFYHSLCEMSASERNRLKDSDFGLPSQRKFPIHDKEHLLQAIRFFNKVDPKDEKELAKNINRAIAKLCDSGEYPNVGRNNRFLKYYKRPVSEAAVVRHCYDLHTNGTNLVTYDGKPTDINDSDDYCPIRLSNIPNYMGINLCSVQSIEWSELPDGQIIDIIIRFIPDDSSNNVEESCLLEASNIGSGFKIIKNPSKELIKAHIGDGECIKDYLDDKVRKNSFVVIDENSNTIVGIFMIFNDKGHKIINNLEITPKYRGQGLSKPLLDIAISNGANHLWVNDDNTVAKNLYLSKGFEFTGDKVKENGKTRLYMELKKSVSESYEITGERGFYHYDGTYNCIVNVTGVDKPLRGRGEILILDSTATKVYLVFKDDKKYKVPGGGFEPNESHLDGTIREAREEARIEVIGAYDTGVRYVEMFDDDVDETQAEFDPENRFYGFYTEVFVGTALEEYTGDLDTVDVDEFMTRGEFYDIKDVWNKLTPEHKKALKANVLTEDSNVNLSNLTYYHLELPVKGKSPKNNTGGWDEELYSKSIQGAIHNDIINSPNFDGNFPVEAHVYTMGEEYSAIYLGKITIYGDDKPNYEWEWAEQEDIDKSFLDYIRDEVHHETNWVFDENIGHYVIAAKPNDQVEEIPETINTKENATLSVSALIWDNGKILLEDHIKANALTLPGGKINPNESPEEAIKRELKEELGIDVIEMDLYGTNTFYCGYPAGSGIYKWFTDHCYVIRKYSGEIQNLEPEKHRELVYLTPDDNLETGNNVSALLHKVLEMMAIKDNEYSISNNVSKASDQDITCTGYLEDLKLLRYIATPDMYNDLLDALEIDFENVPTLNFIACDREDLEINRTANGGTEINILCYSSKLDKVSVKTYIQVAVSHAIVGLIIAKYPNLSGTIFPMAIADFLVYQATGYLCEFIEKLVAKYTMKGLFKLLSGMDIEQMFKLAKEYGVTQIQSTSDIVTESDAITAEKLTNKTKYHASTKIKVAGSKLKNKASKLTDSIKDSIKTDIPKPVTTPASADKKQEVSESMIASLAEGSFIVSGDYVTIFEDATYDPMLKKVLYSERMIKRKEATILLDRVKSDIPEIKYAYLDLNRYASRNLFVDLYYYNQAFFKNNIWKLQKGFNLYLELLDRLINDKRLSQAGYTKRTVFIPINDWHKNPNTRMWMFREDINPISIIYNLMVTNPNGLKKLFNGVGVVFFGDNNYFTIDFEDVKNAKRNAVKFKNFITKINKGEEFSQEDLDSTEDTPTKDAIKADIIDKVEVSKGVDLTPAASEVKKEKEKGKNIVQPNRTPSKQDEEETETPVKDKAAANVSVARDNSKVDKETLKTIADKIDNAVDNSVDVDGALDYMDDDPDLKDLLAGLDSMKDDSVNINIARAERMSQLDRELLDKSLKGRSIRDILDEDKSKEKIELPESKLPIASPNEEWQHMRYMNYDQTYDLEKDIVNAFKHFSNVSRPLAIRNIKVEDNSTSEDRLDLYTVEYEDYRGKRYTIKLDIPRMKNQRFLLRGNLKQIQTQFFNMPIIKVDTDTCQIVSNYKKIIISRFNTASGKSIPNVSRFVKAANKYTGRRIKFTGGDNSLVSAKYVLPIDYIDLSTIFSKIETDRYIIYFNQDEIRKLYDIREGLGVPYAYDKISKEIVYFGNNITTPFIDTLIGLIVLEPEGKDKEFWELYTSAKAPARGTFTRAKIMGSEMPLVVVCAYSEGLTKVMQKANVNYRLVDKLTSADRNDLNHDFIRFSDGYLIYQIDYSSSLLMTGLKDCDTLSHSITEIDDKNMYLEFLDWYGGRIKADGLDNFYDCEIDPITKETLEYYKMPTDYISVLLYANYLLSDNKFIRHTDTCSRRARRAELIAAYTYQVMSEVYGTYANSLKHNRTQAPFSCKQSAVIDKIMLDTTSGDYSVNNLLNDVETTNAITYKGLSGMNSDRSYSLDKRTYDKSMLGVIGMSTGFSGNVGITRQATLDMAIEGGRGYVKDNKGNIEDLNTAKVLTATEAVMPFITTHDDPMRVAMSFIQTSKHAVRTEESDPLLVTSGADEALAYICSDQFAHKAKVKGIIKELTETGMILQYEDGTEEFVNLTETIEKNSDGGFYVPLKLSADPKLKVGSKIKPGDIVAYDRLSLSNSVGESDNLAYNVGKLAKVAIINTDEGFEDSGVITEEMAKKLSCRIIGKADCILDKNTNIFNVAKVGQEVEQGDTLLVWQTPYDEEEVNALLKALANDKEAVSELGRHTVKSEVTGRIAGMKIYRTVNDDELSDSLRKLVRQYERPITELKNKLKSEGIEYSDLPANYPLDATGKLKNSYDSVLIEFYIEYTDILGVGDKITYNAANKAIISKVIPRGKEPTTDFRPNEHISAFVSVTSIQKRMVQSTVTYGSLQKLMIELDRTCKDIAGIPYDDTEV